MAKSEEDELGESMGNARAKDLGGKTMRVSRAKAREVVVAETKADPMAKPSEDEVAEAGEERWTEIEADGGGEAKVDHVVDNGDTFQKIGIEQFESSTTAAPSFLDVFQAIAAESGRLHGHGHPYYRHSDCAGADLLRRQAPRH